MYRLMQPEDKPAVLALWQSQRNESEEFAKKAIEQFAGEQNVYVAVAFPKSWQSLALR